MSVQADPSTVAVALAHLRSRGWQGSDASVPLLAAWAAAERGDFAHAAEILESHRAIPELAGWAAHGQAFVALRQRDLVTCHALLDLAATSDDPTLLALVAHLRGTAFFYEGRSEPARQELLRALAQLGPAHCVAGRVLDTLGMVYAARDNRIAAEEFYRQALATKARFDDEAGLAVSHGQLGRLYLEWGAVDLAEHHFRADLALVQRLGDEWGACKVANQLGQAALLRGDALGAVAWLDPAIGTAVRRGWTLDESFLRKDRAAAAIALGDEEGAEAYLARAAVGFEARGFAEGAAHVRVVLGQLRRLQRRHAESLDALEQAVAWFSARGELLECARASLELARTRVAAGAADATAALLDALRRAETSRHGNLVAEVESELLRVDPAAHWHRLWQRASTARRADDAPTSLSTGSRETATVLYLDIQGSTQYALGRDPSEVMGTLNQMMAEMADVLRTFDVGVSGFRGDGFLAVARGEGAPRRAVSAALGLFAALNEFNEPRRILGLPQFVSRIGIATGPLFFGNVGTYDKLDFSCVGTAANLGARLESRGEAGVPCICEATWSAVRDDFRFGAQSPRRALLKGLGDEPIPMWDVVGLLPR